MINKQETASVKHAIEQSELPDWEKKVLIDILEIMEKMSDLTDKEIHSAVGMPMSYIPQVNTLWYERAQIKKALKDFMFVELFKELL